MDRPDEVEKIVAALKRRRGTVGITTVVQGAGGFGKTTVAMMVSADRRVLRRFRGQVYWVKLGRDVDRQMLASPLNGLITRLDSGRPATFTDTRQASLHLAAMLAAGPRRLLVLDDVWSEEQLAAFPAAGRCARLVTTRIPSLAGATMVPVRIDQMSEPQARALLLTGLPPLPPRISAGLIEETGRWPLLLLLVNKILAEQVRTQPDLTEAAEDLLNRLRRSGALQVDQLNVDQLNRAAIKQLDVNDPEQRHKTITATIQASTSLLNPDDYDRFSELAVFAEDETIPISLITTLWQATGGLEPMASRALCARLADLALLTLLPVSDGGRAVTMHDVIRDLLRRQLGDARLTQLHNMLLESAAKDLPIVAAAAGGGMVTAWWELPAHARYLRDHLIEHLLVVGRSDDAEKVATDLRWAGERLERSGPAAPFSDLARIPSRRTDRLRRVLGQAAHLLAPIDPPHSLLDIFFSRVSHDPEWGPQARALSYSRKLPALINKWPLPDLPDPALHRILTSSTGAMNAVAIAPDGTWLATGGSDGMVRIWDPATGQQRTRLTGHAGPVYAVAVAPDGTWLATGGSDGTVRIWDLATGQQRTHFTRQTVIAAVAVAPDGTWLAAGGSDGIVWIWDPMTGQQRARLTGHAGPVYPIAIAPDGTWLAVGGQDGTVRIWDPVTGQRCTHLTSHTGVAAVAIAPDGSWLVTGGSDGMVRIWDLATGRQRTRLTGHTEPVYTAAIAPDGTWLATSGPDKTVRIWDPATGQQRARLTGHTGRVYAVAIAPDGTWLATGGQDGTVRTWDPATGQQRTHRSGHREPEVAVAIAPDGTWLATGGQDGTVRTWDLATGQQRARLTGHTGRVYAVAIAPDGTWLATGGQDGTVRTWDSATGQQRARLTGHTGRVYAVAIAPDGTWLATGGQDGIVRTWDPATGQRRARLTGHTGSIAAVSFSSDGTWLVSRS